MQANDKNIEQRISSLSDSKAKLLEKLLQEQRKKKQAARQKQVNLSQIQKREENLETLPCSYMQKKFWYVEQITKNSIAYNTSGYVKFTGRLDTICLKKAFAEVVKREEALRSSFVEEQGAVVVKLKELDLDAIYKERNCTDRNYSEEERIEMMMEEGSIPFHLEKGNLIRLTCYQFSDTDWIGQITWHHIVSDGYSSGIFIKELFEIYEKFVDNRYTETENPEIKYYDYVIHTKKLLEENKYESKLNYWTDSLEGSAMKCEIPSDFPVDNVVTYQGDRVPFAISQELKNKIEETAKQHNVTNFCVLMSALKIMLHKYVSQDDIIVGTPVIGRDLQEFQDIIGCFINMLPIRSVINKEMKAVDYIKSENVTILNALKNQELPFDYMVEQMKVEKDIYSTPVYQVVFSYEGNAIKDISVKGLQIAFAELNLKTAKVDLALEVNDAEDGYEAWFEYKSSKFARERIEKIVQYYITILEELVSAKEEKIDELEMITTQEKNQILHTFNRQTSSTYEPKTIADIFEEMVKQYPDKTAIIDKDTTITYKELNEKANQLAAYLRKLGIKEETIVAVMLDKSIEAFLALLGISKAGGTYLPLDLTYPKDRIAYILEDSKAAYVIVDETNTESYEQAKRISIKDASILAETKENLGLEYSYRNLAYIIYTSGTTGKPKGVMVEHTGIQNLKEYFMSEYKVTKDDVVLQFANLVFDASIWEFVMGLLTGATLCIVTKDVILNAAEFMRTLEKHRVTVATLPPQYWTMIQDKSPALRVLITAGAEANANMLQDLNEVTTYYNAYGPTETTVCATDWRFERSRTIPSPIPIGKPIANMQVYIMNQNNLCGIGRVGELCIAGVGVARGYLNRETLTKEKFTANPFGDGNMYRTGDYASWTKDGNIRFHGRIDTQVKIHGYRIEMGEIEKAVLSLELVKDAVVAAKTDDKGEKSLVCYLITEDSLTVNEIRDELFRKLPNYMVPSSFYKVSSIPLNVNGKVDLEKIEQLGEKMILECEYVEAENSTEKTLADIWCECLNIETISMTENYFEIGGDSIICMQIIAKAAEKGLKIELKSFYDDKCIREMAKHVQMLDSSSDEQGEITGEISLTPIQQWFMRQQYEQEAYWNQSVMLEVKELQITTLNKALNEVRKQHDLLRAQFIKVNNSWKLNILPYEEKELVQVAKVTGKSEEEHAIMALQQSINIDGGDAFRALVLEAEGGMRLVLSAHHLICDAVSYRYLIEDLFHFYNELIHSQEISYPMKSNSFLHWEKELSGYVQADNTYSRIKWWKQQKLNQLCKLPKDYEEGSNLEQDAVTLIHNFSKEETESLQKDVPKNYNISTKELLTACLSIVLKDWDQQVHPIYMESYGRDILTEVVNISRTVGWFTQVYPFLMEINDELSFGDILKKCKDALAEVEQHKTEYLLLADHDMQSMLELERNSILFNYLGQLDNVVDENSDFKILNGRQLFPRGGKNHRPFLIDITAYISDGQLYLELCYSRKIYKESTVNDLLTKMKCKITEAIRYCIETDESGLSASDFSDVDMEDLDFILSKFN